MQNRPDWSEWILQKNNEAKQEELRKSNSFTKNGINLIKHKIFEILETLEKARKITTPFKHGSKIKLLDSDSDKTYNVEETLDPIENDPEISNLKNEIMHLQMIHNDEKHAQSRIEDVQRRLFGDNQSKWEKSALDAHKKRGDNSNQAFIKLISARKRIDERKQEIFDKKEPPTTILHQMPFSSIDKLTNKHGFQLRLTDRYDGADSHLYDRYNSGIVDLKHPSGPSIMPGEDKPHTPAGSGRYRGQQ